MLDVNGKYSYGGLMFQSQTLLYYGKESGILPWYFTENDVLKNDLIYDKETQTAIADYMIGVGKGNHAWYNCYKKLNL